MQTRRPNNLTIRSPLPNKSNVLSPSNSMWWKIGKTGSIAPYRKSAVIDSCQNGETQESKFAKTKQQNCVKLDAIDKTGCGSLKRLPTAKYKTTTTMTIRVWSPISLKMFRKTWYQNSHKSKSDTPRKEATVLHSWSQTKYRATKK